MATRQLTPRTQFLLAYGLSTVAAVMLFAYGAYRNRSLHYDYLIWNLFLAWLPLLVAARLTQVLRRKLWSSWEALALTLLWLIFLPNSFYMVSDFIHLQGVKTVDILYDAVMFTAFVLTALLLGATSLYLVHVELKKRLRTKTVAVLLGLILLACSLAIYVGRDLRWNSWDVIFNPAGLLFDLSDRFLHPRAYPQMGLTVGSFFVLLSSVYSLLWRTVQLVRFEAAQELAHRLHEHPELALRAAGRRR